MYRFLYLQYMEKHYRKKRWWGSGQVTPKYSTWVYWISNTEGIWENGRSKKVTLTSASTFFPETGRNSRVWRAPSPTPGGKTPHHLRWGIWGQEIHTNQLCLTNPCLPSHFFTIYSPSPTPFVLLILHKSIVSLSERCRRFLLRLLRVFILLWTCKRSITFVSFCPVNLPLSA